VVTLQSAGVWTAGAGGRGCQQGIYRDLNDYKSIPLVFQIILPAPGIHLLLVLFALFLSSLRLSWSFMTIPFSGCLQFVPDAGFSTSAFSFMVDFVKPVFVETDFVKVALVCRTGIREFSDFPLSVSEESVISFW
jgi:hypothetical protein